MSDERRDQKRFSMNLQARIHYRHTQTTEPAVETVAANISCGGAFLNTSHPFPLASKVRIDFLLDLQTLQKLRFIIDTEGLRRLNDGPIWVTISGVVIRKNSSGIAVIFDQNPRVTPLISVD